MSFGARLKALRISNKLTQKEVSEKTGIALRHYQDLEAENHKPGMGSLIALSDLYRTSIDYLLAREEMARASEVHEYANISDKKPMIYARTFFDMEEERHELLKALLEVDGIPVGMLRMAPPCDDYMQKLIRKLIAECDYYLMALSMHDSAYSSDVLQTLQHEFSYAASLKKPCIILIRKPYVEIESPRVSMLTAFLEKSKPRIYILDYWRSLEDLGKSTCRNIIQLRYRHPPVGWIRGNELTKEQLRKEAALYEKIENLEAVIRQMGSRADGE